MALTDCAASVGEWRCKHAACRTPNPQKRLSNSQAAKTSPDLQHPFGLLNERCRTMDGCFGLAGLCGEIGIGKDVLTIKGAHPAIPELSIFVKPPSILETPQADLSPYTRCEGLFFLRFGAGKQNMHQSSIYRLVRPPGNVRVYLLTASASRASRL